MVWIVKNECNAVLFNLDRHTVRGQVMIQIYNKVLSIPWKVIHIQVILIGNSYADYLNTDDFPRYGHSVTVRYSGVILPWQGLATFVMRPCHT